MNKNRIVSLLAQAALFLRPVFPQAASPPPAATATTTTVIPLVQPRVREDMDTPKGTITRIHLLAHFATTVSMPEGDDVRTIVVGDPLLFSAEHQPGDASLVVITPLKEDPAQSNLEITTVSGKRAVFLLTSDSNLNVPVDFALRFGAPAEKEPKSFWRNETNMPSVVVAETISVADADPEHDPAASPSAKATLVNLNDTDMEPRKETGEDANLGKLLEEQQQAPLPELFGQHPGSIKDERHLRAGVSQVLDGGGTVVVTFSVLNSAPHAIALLPPQVQLGGQVKKKWTTAEQLPVLRYKLDRDRLPPGARANGVVVFDRPTFKQSTESLFLQIAESGAVDQPALAPIGFGVSSHKGGIATTDARLSK